MEAIYTYGHPLVDAALLDRLPGSASSAILAWASITSTLRRRRHGTSRLEIPLAFSTEPRPIRLHPGPGGLPAV